MVMRTCNHSSRRNSLVQQVSRHRAVWDKDPVPPGFWNSDFPDEQQLEQQRQEAEKREAERIKQIAEEAESGNGRWKKRVNS